ncbi:hypothetical protein ANN_14950 [Periplaneta americana]|uniref:DUF4817 domain-containing protein n=1 Tax=Periplaneta americana TaxID=6978 RepID=A0ABQ8SZ69_PERAM|nr:hypothetical protein ANN_14950 [Periplaneta americana]
MVNGWNLAILYCLIYTENLLQGTMIEMQFEVSRPCEDFPDGDIKLSNLSMEQLGRNQMAMSGLLDMKVTLDERFQVSKHRFPLNYGALVPVGDKPNCTTVENNISSEFVKKENFRYLSDTNPQFLHETPLQSTKLMVTLIRCNSKSDRGNCEEFPPSPITDMCEKLPQEDQIWTDFVHKLQNFTPKCPVPPGSYAFHQHKLDMDSVANMPLMVGYWIMKSEGFVGEDKVMCELSEMSFTRKKIKKGSLPSKETLRGHSDSSFRGEGYIQCCVGVRLCDMYSNQELAEIHFMYGKADGNAALARRLYQERYPQRQCPDRKTFVRLHYRLCEYGKFNSPGLGRGRPRSTTPEVQEEILEAVNMTPSISTRRVALQVNVPHTTVWRLLKEYQLYPYHLQRVQALSPADYPARVRFCQWFLQQCGVNPNFPGVWDRVRRSMRHRCEVCIQAGGGHFEHLL